MVNGWRMLMGLQIIPALCLLMGIMFLPESPRWLLDKKENESAALRTLERIRGKDDGSIYEELEEIKENIRIEHLLAKSRWRDLVGRSMLYLLVL
jgi:hypothetical protein